MKIRIFSITLLFVSGIYVNKAKAQLLPEFGLRTGVNFASIGNAKQEVDSRRIGLLAGVYAVIPIMGTSFSIQPEVLYTQKGAEINNVEINLSYIQVPVFARINFTTESILAPHLLLGPYVGFNLTSENSFTVNKTVFGLAIGAGIDISSITFGARYSQGLSKVFKTEE